MGAPEFGPTREQFEALQGADLESRVVMVNFLKFTARAWPPRGYLFDITPDIGRSGKFGAQLYGQIETVDAVGKVGFFSALDIDPFGNIGISYGDATNNDLKFAFAQAPGVLPHSRRAPRDRFLPLF